jgi:anti-sigma B factor antagonist
LTETVVKPLNEILVTIRKNCAMIKVNGYVSFKMGPSIKRFGAAAVDNGCTKIIFDMERCLGMDSTFMGVMAGLAIRTKNDVKGEVVAMNLSPKTDSLLATLGLNRLIDCYQVGLLSEKLESELADIMDLENLELDGQDKLSSLTTMLEAHQNLIDVSPEENLPRFKDVITYLEQDLKAI